ncbi:MAG: NAD(P)H-dependent glycerol-3-phosphate dehydrogenase [Gammaproteobacteria bacterium]
MSSNIITFGAGAWGTALSMVLADGGNCVTLLVRDKAQAQVMRDSRENNKYLPGINLPANLDLIHRWQDIPASSTLVLIAVPFQQARQTLVDIREFGLTPSGVMWASKGIEQGSHAMAHEMVAAELGEEIPFAVISGPNFAAEVAQRLPAAITVASETAEFLAQVCRAFHTDYFRPYSSDDVIGVQIGGAVKNVIAIAAGISDGLRLGANARAALVTRGLAEIARWGTHLGGRTETFMGLSGLGDLVLTCTDDLSRNRRFGLQLASGDSVSEASAKIGLVEGAKTSLALAEITAREGIEMPITKQVARMVAGEVSPQQAVTALMSRELGAEQ